LCAMEGLLREVLEIVLAKGPPGIPSEWKAMTPLVKRPSNYELSLRHRNYARKFKADRKPEEAAEGASRDNAV
jgi:hypothetical protein